jgi:FixJ family two-component response regulator
VSAEVCRVFIIDDEYSVRKSLSLLLRVEGYQVEEFASGMDALPAFAARPPNGVLTDYHMPGLSGEELIRQLRSVDPTVPIVLLTGRDDWARIKLDGTVRVLQKPVNADVLLDLLRTVIPGPG